MTEMPFVDLMHNAREWYTKDVDNPSGAFDSGFASELTYRTDGYPTQVPQTVSGSSFSQRVATVWGSTSGWPEGVYTVTFEGSGEVSVSGSASDVTVVDSHKITFKMTNPEGGVVELVILSSEAADPVHNIRVLMPGMENATAEEPFNPAWLEKLELFKTVRFMDWGATNHWGQAVPWEWDNPNLVDWSGRSTEDHYTWATSKGVPYEVMIRLMNDHDLDGWVCIPHKASDDYIRNMAQLFRDELEPGRKLYIEYSNELWNWIFGQAQWLNHYGCEQKGVSWPEGLVPYIQNAMDIWTEEFEGELGRIVRVVAVQTGWQDVSNRIVFGMEEGSFDAFAPAYYFNFSEEGEAALDALGSSATIQDIAFYARENFDQSFDWIATQKETIGDELNIPMVFYEGGQHLTPVPFGEAPSYEQALVDIQRDAEMYKLYSEWFDRLETLQEGDEPLLLMNFSLIGSLSAQYGSWGILETLDQDLNVTPAPKYKAIADYSCNPGESPLGLRTESETVIYPNPARGYFQLYVKGSEWNELEVLTTSGQLIKSLKIQPGIHSIDLYDRPGGIYIVKLKGRYSQVSKILINTH